MRRRLLITALLCANLLLAPLGMMHAHIAEDSHPETHGGHLHAFDHAPDQGDADTIVELDKFSNPATAKIGWLGFAAVFFLVCIGVLSSLRHGFLRPRRRATEPIPWRPCISPPLRGPPCYSV